MQNRSQNNNQQHPRHTALHTTLKQHKQTVVMYDAHGPFIY